MTVCGRKERPALREEDRAFRQVGTVSGRLEVDAHRGLDGVVLTAGVTTFYLMDLVIEEKYRSQGFGTILMDRIMKENGHLYGMLHTTDAKAFYEKYGFRAIGDTKKTEEIYMEKPCS